MNRKVPELQKIVRPADAGGDQDFLFTLKRGLLLDLTERGILSREDFERAARKLVPE